MWKLMVVSVIAPLALCPPATAQNTVLFDFDTAPLYAPLPLNVVAGGITAHLSATGQGYSIQGVGTAPVVPAGFTGHFVYPSSIYLADLLISFSQTITAFSIVCAPQEIGCDDSATLRVTAYSGPVFVGTNTATSPNPGTWPSTTLSCTFAQGFNNVVVHYAAQPPTCQDWGPIFVADTMNITVGAPASVASAGTGCGGTGMPSFTVSAPQIGALVTMSLAQTTPNRSGYVYLSVGPAVPLALGSGCTIEVDLATMIPFLPVIANGAGSWSVSFAMPLNPSLVGVTARMQTALFGTSGPFGVDLSNGVIATIGY